MQKLQDNKCQKNLNDFFFIPVILKEETGQSHVLQWINKIFASQDDFQLEPIVVDLSGEETDRDKGKSNLIKH